MSQHLSQSDLHGYLDGTNSASELLAADAHLAVCDECFAMAAELRQRPEMPARLSNGSNANDDMDGHLTYEQLTAFVDGVIGDVDREIVGVHTADCPKCTEQIAELRHLRSTLELENAPELGVKSPEPESPLSRLWKDISTGAYLKFAAPTFALLLIGLVVWSVWMLSALRTAEVVEVAAPPVNDSHIDKNILSDNTISAVNGPANSNSTLPRPSISLADGGTKIELDEKGGLVGLNAPQFESRVIAALTKESIEISQAAKALGGKTGRLMGGDNSGSPFELTSPVGRIVETDRPHFNWRPLTGADSYVVTIYDANFKKIAESPTLKQPGWTASTRLERGKVYQWQVTAVKGGEEVKSPVRPAPDARFKILDASNANEIEAAKRQNGNSHLLLGIVYANAGLLSEAEREFQALLDQNPKSEIARRLLGKVRAAR